MKRILLALPLIVAACSSDAQVIKVQGGISGSSLNWKTPLGSGYFFNKPVTGYAASVGLSYLEHKYFSLSSNIGAMRKGGAEDITYSQLQGDTHTERETITLDYLSLNTTVDFKLPVQKITPFASIGPRIDYLIASHRSYASLVPGSSLNKIAYGLTMGAGVNYQLARLLVGLRGDYLLNFSKVSEYRNADGTTAGTVKDRTFLVQATVGYRIR